MGTTLFKDELWICFNTGLIFTNTSYNVNSWGLPKPLYLQAKAPCMHIFYIHTFRYKEARLGYMHTVFTYYIDMEGNICEFLHLLNQMKWNCPEIALKESFLLINEKVLSNKNKMENYCWSFCPEGHSCQKSFKPLAIYLINSHVIVTLYKRF